MQRDVKVGLVLGVLLVAVVAVVFFRRDEDDRDKFTKLLPAPDAVADRARDMLGPAPSDPYPVAPEYLESWQSPKSKTVRAPMTSRNKNNDASAPADWADRQANEESHAPSSAVAVLQRPEFEPQRSAARTKLDVPPARARSANPDSVARSGSGMEEYTIQDGDTLSDIARRKLGSGTLYYQLYEENKDVLSDPSNIPVGQKIRIPVTAKSDRAAAPDRQAAQTAAPHSGSTITAARTSRTTARNDSTRNNSDSGRSYVVKDGDSLIRIAREHYGRDSMYLDILHANQDQITNAVDIQPGMVLRLP